MEFTKMQGAGNDFVVVDARHLERDWSTLARAMCDRHFGIGADSLILIGDSDRADFLMRTFDADGLEAETCGNGIRCLGRYALEKGMIDLTATGMTIETIAVINHLEFVRVQGKVTGFRVSMGRPRFAAGEIPVKFTAGIEVKEINGMSTCRLAVEGKQLVLNLVSMGNPHAVLFIDQPVGEYPLLTLGPLVEHHFIFPNRSNFMVARVLDSSHIEARSWERGCGETLACGSGACAIAVAAIKLGYAATEVAISLPGGILDAAWDGNGEVILGGPAEVVFEGTWPD